MISLNNAEARLKLAQINLTDAKRELDRQYKLFEKKIKPKLPPIEIENDKKNKEACKLLFQDQETRDMFNNYVFDKYKERMEVDLFNLMQRGVK